MHSNHSHKPRLHIALIEPEVPGNTGNIGRTCLALDAQLHLIRPLGFALTDAALQRAGLDYWAHVDVAYHDSLADFLVVLPTLGVPCLLETSGSQSLYDLSLPAHANPVLLFGSESTGLPQTLLTQYAAHTFHIPMYSPHIRSLNLSNSVAIAAYEMLRRRIVTPFHPSSTVQT